jgi:hypothetical protein
LRARAFDIASMLAAILADEANELRKRDGCSIRSDSFCAQIDFGVFDG